MWCRKHLGTLDWRAALNRASSDQNIFVFLGMCYGFGVGWDFEETYTTISMDLETLSRGKQAMQRGISDPRTSANLLASIYPGEPGISCWRDA